MNAEVRNFTFPCTQRWLGMSPMGRIDDEGGSGFDRRERASSKIGAIAGIALALASPLGGQAAQEPDAVIRLFEVLNGDRVR